MAKTSNDKSDNGNSRIAVFLGAGASAAGGFRTFLSFPHMFWPTSSDPAILHATDKERVLLSSIKRELIRKKKALTLDQYLWILNDYNIVLQNSFSDEELRSRFSDSLLFWSKMQELNHLVQRAKRSICALTMGHYRNPPSMEYFIRARHFYSKLLSKYDVVDIFTTNYDTVPEYVLSGNQFLMNEAISSWPDKPDIKQIKLEDLIEEEPILKDINFSNGFANFSEHDFSIDSVDLEWRRKNYALIGKKALSIFRLHGCVSWFYGDSISNSPVYFVKDPRNIANAYDKVCIMYPGKEERVGKDPHAFGFERLYEACLKYKTLIFSGFAFRDIDVVSVVFSALKQRESFGKDRLRIIILDPFLTYDDFLERIKEMRWTVAIPMEIDKNRIDIQTLRIGFPPEKNEIGVILDSIH